MTICFDVSSLIVKSCNEVPLVCVWQIAKASVFPKVFGKISHGTLVKIFHHNRMIPLLGYRRSIWIFWRALRRTGNIRMHLLHFPKAGQDQAFLNIKAHGGISQENLLLSMSLLFPMISMKVFGDVLDQLKSSDKDKIPWTCWTWWLGRCFSLNAEVWNCKRFHRPTESVSD